MISGVSVERGEDTSALLVVFSGLAQRWGMGGHEFAGTASRLRYSRILCRDVHDRAYLEGFDRATPSLDAALDWLQEEIARLAPKRTLFIGNSVGAYAALLYGHLLGADTVQAFAPITCLDRPYVERHRELDDAGRAWYEQLWALPPPAQDSFDLAQVLATHNGRTQYHVHHCDGCASDQHAAQHLAQAPGVQVHSHACHNHLVSRHLARRGLLFKLLRPENQDAVRTLLGDDDTRGERHVG
ncbi:MAG: hypothetical protein AAF184_00065 [Pseudomonadota bacterium]